MKTSEYQRGKKIGLHLEIDKSKDPKLWKKFREIDEMWYRDTNINTDIIRRMIYDVGDYLNDKTVRLSEGKFQAIKSLINTPYGNDNGWLSVNDAIQKIIDEKLVSIKSQSIMQRRVLSFLDSKLEVNLAIKIQMEVNNKYPLQSIQNGEYVMTLSEIRGLLYSDPSYNKRIKLILEEWVLKRLIFKDEYADDRETYIIPVIIH